MNNDTIKAAEDAEKMFAEDQIKQAFIAGSEHMQAQKDEQIKELVEAMQEFTEAIESEEITIQENFDNDGYENCGGRLYQRHKQLIQKYKA